jgi:5-methylcytosine-specific restriction endonuclease McrA
MKDKEVLLLNYDYTPYQIVGWRRAMVLLLSDRARALEYTEHTISSPNKEWKVPSVLVLEKTKTAPKGRRVPLTRKNLALRDNHSCQYCGVKASFGAEGIPLKEMTMDHVVPRSTGGPTAWDNIVLSCKECNTAKGNRTLAEMKWVLKKKPIRPDRASIVKLYVATYKDSGQFPKSWVTWLGLDM